jgi:hypothetical protein
MFDTEYLTLGVVRSLAAFRRKKLPSSSEQAETEDRALARESSRWLLTTAARIRARVRSCGICDGQSGTEQVFSEHFSSLATHSSNRSQLIIHHPGLVQ